MYNANKTKLRTCVDHFRMWFNYANVARTQPQKVLHACVAEKTRRKLDSKQGRSTQQRVKRNARKHARKSTTATA